MKTEKNLLLYFGNLFGHSTLRKVPIKNLNLLFYFWKKRCVVKLRWMGTWEKGEKKIQNICNNTLIQIFIHPFIIIIANEYFLKLFRFFFFVVVCVFLIENHILFHCATGWTNICFLRNNLWINLNKIKCNYSI